MSKYPVQPSMAHIPPVRPSPQFQYPQERAQLPIRSLATPRIYDSHPSAGVTHSGRSEEAVSPGSPYTPSVASSGFSEKPCDADSQGWRLSYPEKVRLASRENRHSRSRASGDLEKQLPSSMAAIHTPTALTYHDQTDVLYPVDEEDFEEAGAHSLRILLYLSGPCSFYSLFALFWTFFALVLTVLLQPLRLCSFRPSFGEQLRAFLSPVLRLHLRFIYSKSLSRTSDNAVLLFVLILSPLISVGVALAAWTAAFFWFFSAILGDPAGKDGHNDGKATVLGVRNWWERWLIRPMR